MREGASSVYYVEQLVRHAQPELKEKKVKNKLLDKLQPLSTVLKQLEVDIRTSTSVRCARCLYNVSYIELVLESSNLNFNCFHIFIT